MKLRIHGSLVALALCACSTTSTNGAADAGVDGATASGKKVTPTALRSFEANGEGMCEAPATPDWLTSQMLLDQANGTWATLRPQLLGDGARATSLAQVDMLLAKYTTDVKQTIVRDAETDANTMNALIPEFFELYDFAVPSDAQRLDAAYRLVEIQGQHSDFVTATTALDKTKAIWARLRPVVAAKAPSRTDIPAAMTVVADVDATFGNIEAAITAKNALDLKKAATVGLDLVDVLEQTFQ